MSVFGSGISSLCLFSFFRASSSELSVGSSLLSLLSFSSEFWWLESEECGAAPFGSEFFTVAEGFSLAPSAAGSSLMMRNLFSAFSDWIACRFTALFQKVVSFSALIPTIYPLATSAGRLYISLGSISTMASLILRDTFFPDIATGLSSSTTGAAPWSVRMQ